MGIEDERVTAKHRNLCCIFWMYDGESLCFWVSGSKVKNTPKVLPGNQKSATIDKEIGDSWMLRGLMTA